MKRLALVVLALSLLSACSNDQTPTVSPTTPGPTQSSPSPTPTGQATGTVNVATSSLGSILVDAQGRTLYLFKRDTGGSPSCYDQCASTWPALEASGSPQAGAGVNASLLGTAQRTDGTTQVTYNNHPLYHFANDQAPGDTNGQGIGGNWFVVSPAGEAIEG
jgi:predicted lipoprotein with Yx(FWY)xxD motif